MVRVHRHACRLIIVAVFLGSVATVSASAEPTVLVLYSDPTLLPATAVFTEGLRQSLQSAQVQLEAQYLDISRFAAEEDQRRFAEWLASHFRDREIPVVVTVGVPASAFASRFAATIWPRARVVHAAIDGDELDAVVKRGEAAVPRILDYRGTIEAALILFPDVRQVVMVGGATEQDRRWLDQAEANLAPLRDRIHIDRVAGLRWQDTLAGVGALPADVIALPIAFFADADNRTFTNADAVNEIARAANRPVFVTSLAFVGTGAVGGYVMDPHGLGRQAALAVLTILDRPNRSTDPENAVGTRWVFDAVQLQRWGVSEAALPAGSDIVNRQPSLWSQYRGYVIGAVSLVALQSLLIGGLLVQRARRRRAESAVRSSEAALRMSYERIRQLAARLIGAQETARTRIARDLHDDVCQELASMSIAVGDVKDREGDIRDSRTQQALSALHKRTLDLAQGVRRLSHDLHPSTLRHVGLAAALEAHCVEVEQRYDLQVQFDSDGDLRELPGDTAVALFRIAQEALRNAATHGGARRVALSVTKADEATELIVTDDGTGFDRDEICRHGAGLGLVSMEERARLVDGELRIVTAPGKGTTIRARVSQGAAVSREQRP